jgi:hypothetical protein
MSDFPHSNLAAKVALLASSGSYIGTSSWKYEGWLGLIYTPERYWTRGRFSRAKFEKTCLAEYAETFKTVCADAGYSKDFSVGFRQVAEFQRQAD